METDTHPPMEAVADDPLLRKLVSIMIRRRTEGYAPVLIVSVNDDDQVISDTLIEPEEFDEFLEYLWTSRTLPRREPEDQ